MLHVAQLRYLVESERVSVSVDGTVTGGHHIPGTGVQVVTIETKEV